MAAKRKKPINSFFQQQMKRHGWSSIKEAAAAIGIPYTTLLNYAGLDFVNGDILTAKKMAEAFNMRLDDFVEDLLRSIDLDRAAA